MNILVRRIYRLGAVCILLVAALFLAVAHRDGRAVAQQDEQLLLPIVVGDNNPTPTVAPTVIPTPPPSPTPDPAIPVGGQCVAGRHLVHKETGAPDIEHEDPAGYLDDDLLPGSDTYRDEDYMCVPNQTARDIACGANGTARVVDGIAVCACREGYGGATCERCAQGYDVEGGVCKLVDVPELVIQGLADSFAPGESRVLTPTGIVARDFEWELSGPGSGCFLDGSACARSTRGLSATYIAPTAVSDMDVISFTVTSLDPTGSPPFEWEANVLVMPSDQIPVSGSGDPRLMPIVQHLRTYMQHRCIGAATFGVSRNGVILGAWSLGRMEGPAASKAVWDSECGDPMLEVNQLAPPVPMDTPFLIGSNSKYHTSAVLRWALKTVAQQEGGLNLTDAQILGLRPFDANNYPPLIPGTNQPFPVPIVPQDVHSVMAGLTPYPVFLADSTVYGQLEDGETLCDNSSVADGFADPQWRDVTIGDIISHRTGLPRSAPRYEQDTVSNLAVLRGLTSDQDFVAQEAILRSQWSNAKVNAAKNALGYPAGTTLYVIPRPTLAEFFHVLAGRCLRYPLGMHKYSNTSPGLSVLIIEHLTASGNFVARLGDPASHQGSALQIFLQSTVGIATTASDGIFAIQSGINIPGYVAPGPAFRNWSSSEGSYTYTRWDPKQPHCVWNAGNSTCSFADWRNPTDERGRIDWSMVYHQVPFWATGTALNPGTGSFMVEARDELRFLAQYQIGAYGTPASVGRPRAGQPNGSYSHNGSLNGGFSYARQISGSTSKSMNLPPLDAQGRLTDDYGNLQTFTCPVSLPDGVDYIVALGQRSDRKCALDGACSDYYRVLDAVMRYGICQVNWATVPTVLNLAQSN